jgi:hypothetical protein
MHKQLAAILVIIAGFAFIAVGNLAYFTIVEELNAELESEDRTEVAFSGGRWLSIVDQHARQCPVSPKRRLMFGCFLAGALLLVVAFIVL